MKKLKNLLFPIGLAVILLLLSSSLVSGKQLERSKKVIAYTTSADKSKLFEQSIIKTSNNYKTNSDLTLTVNPVHSFQQIDGFGVAITGSTCYNLLKMSETDRKKLLEETFNPKSGMGFSYIRISLGCSDFSLDEYTYCDKPGIENFAIHDLDKQYLFPVLKEILAINPKIKILASPWTCPRWMKVNNLIDLQPFNSWTSGQLNPQYYQDYAEYFVRYILEMKRNGFNIDAVTIQNEPLNRRNSVSLYMTWQEQAAFIKNALAPKFKENNIATKIVVFDHNFNYDNIPDQQSYPAKIYADPEAAKYVDGAAYHAYGGDKEEMTKIHEVFPDKNLYFTEMSIGSWNYSFDGDLMWSMREIGIGSLNNFSKNVIVWNFMLDENGAPNRPGGCNTCYGAIEIKSSDYKTLDKKSHYYLISHLSKVIYPGAVRIEVIPDKRVEGVYFTAAKNQDGSEGIVLQNDTDTQKVISIREGNQFFQCTLPEKSIVSCKW
jgi:glucosylceramidase